MTTLQFYIEDAKCRYDQRVQENPNHSIPFENEELVWAIQGWYSMKGNFTKTELKYLRDVWNLEANDIEFLVQIVQHIKGGKNMGLGILALMGIYVIYRLLTWDGK